MSPTPTTPSAEAPLSAEAEGVKEKIVLQGEKIRQLKSDKAPQVGAGLTFILILI